MAHVQPQAGRDITQGTQPRILVRASLVRLSNSAKKRGWRRVLTVRRVNIILGSERQERRMQYSVWASCRVGRSEVMSAIFFSFALSASATIRAFKIFFKNGAFLKKMFFF